MVKLFVRQCDGADKGKLCKNIIERAFHNFFARGVKNIEDACNNRRVSLLQEWQSKDQEAAMLPYGLPDIPYRRGIEEITPPFELTEPDTIELHIVEGEKSPLNEGLAAMDIRPLNNELTTLRLNAYLDVMDYSNDGLQWMGFHDSIEAVTYHELLRSRKGVGSLFLMLGIKSYTLRL